MQQAYVAMIDTIILQAGSSDIRREMKCQCNGGVADVFCHVDVVLFARLCHDWCIRNLGEHVTALRLVTRL